MCPHKIEPVRKYLENHSDNLLEFVPTMEMCFYEIAQEFEVPLSDSFGCLSITRFTFIKPKALGKICRIENSTRRKILLDRVNGR